MGNKAAFIKVVVEQFRLLPSPIDNPKLVKEWLERLTDKEFDEFVTRIEEGKDFLTFIIDNFDVRFTQGQLKKAAEDIGAPVFSKVVEEDLATGLVRTSNETHWIAFQPKRRQIQDVDDKRSTASDSNTRDIMTGQVTGDSKGSAIAVGQLSAILARNCTSTATEFSRLRGGDVAAGAVFTRYLSETGGASIEAIGKINSCPTVNETLSSYLNSIHIANNITR
jgi:hypothetical protein